MIDDDHPLLLPQCCCSFCGPAFWRLKSSPRRLWQKLMITGTPQLLQQLMVDQRGRCSAPTTTLETASKHWHHNIKIYRCFGSLEQKRWPNLVSEEFQLPMCSHKPDSALARMAFGMLIIQLSMLVQTVGQWESLPIFLYCMLRHFPRNKTIWLRCQQIRLLQTDGRPAAVTLTRNCQSPTAQKKVPWIYVRGGVASWIIDKEEDR